MINSFVEATAAKGDALSLDGLRVDDAIAKVNAWLESAGIGKGTVSYRLRDWLFSRQRYWVSLSRSSTARTAPRICCRIPRCRSTCRRA